MNVRNGLSLALLCIAAVLLPSCAEKQPPAAPAMPQDPNGNFILYVSNQSFAVNPVDITIAIDGESAVEADFDVAGGHVPQHNWVRHQFALEPGTHTITAASEKGKAALEKQFEITDKHWAVIAYWYYPDNARGATPTPRKFSFIIKDEPIMFQ